MRLSTRTLNGPYETRYSNSMTMRIRRTLQRGSAALWLVAVAALAVLVIAGLVAATRPARLRSQGYPVLTSSPLADDDTHVVKVKNSKTTDCKVTNRKDKDASDATINCGSDCEQKYKTGSDLTLYVYPADGWEFDKWENVSNCQGCVDSGSSNCMILVSNDDIECKVTCKKKTSSPAPSP